MKSPCFIWLFVCMFAFDSAFTQQLYFEPSNTIPVTIDGDSLTNAWAGGINSSTIASIDLDNNGKEDLLVFDRESKRLLVLFSHNNKFVFEPEIEIVLPKLDRYALSYDFDADGKKDLFTHTTLGIKVYRNTTTTSIPSFRLVKDPILTQYYSALVNMDISSLDIPALADIDLDGDMDILHFRSSTGATLDHHVNMSMEMYGKPDSLIFKNLDYCFGGFREYTCKTYLFDDPEKCKNHFRLEHAGAGSVLAIDFNNDSDMDLMLGKEDCNNLNFLENKGSATSPLFNKLTSSFPSLFPIDSLPYPISFYEDLDFDGKKDLIVAMGSIGPTQYVDQSRTLWWYKNTGTQKVPEFSSSPTKDMLQNEMVELGANTSPAFLDIDGDGDLDMLVGNSTTNASSSLSYFVNNGGKEHPSFSMNSTDYLSLSSFGYDMVCPTMVDLNSDQTLDLIVTVQKNGVTSSFVYFNTVQEGFQPNQNAYHLDFGYSEPYSLSFFDIDNDGFQDALLGTQEGTINYYRNQGNGSNPFFTLQVSEYGGFRPNDTYTNGNPSISIGDFDADFRQDLVLGDDLGHLSLYSDFLSQPTSNFTGNELLTSLKQSNVLGSHLSIANADLDNDGRPEIIVGNSLGGLQLLKYRSTITTSLQRFLPVLEKGIWLHPNPTDGPFEVTLPEPGDLKVSDILGNVLYHIPTHNSLVVKCNKAFPAGIYFVYFHGQSGMKACQKLIIR